MPWDTGYAQVMVGPPQLLIILVIVLLLFGGAKLPALARSIGQAQKEFQKGLKEGFSDDEEEATEADGKKAGAKDSTKNNS